MEPSRMPSPERLQAIIDNALDGLMTMDKNGHIETFNPACERIFGYRAEDVIGQDIKILMSDAFYSVYADYIKNDHQGDKAVTMGAEQTIEGLRWDGSRFPLEFSLSAFELGDGTHYCGVARDTDAQRQQLMEKLMQSNTELERFAYVASHDMQEPVRMVISFSKIIAENYGCRLDSEGKKYMTFITESAQRIHEMIEDLLNYARIDNGENHLTLVDGAAEITHVLNNLGALIKESNAQITCDALPVFHGNPIQFMRLMQNLIANAIKYQPPGNIPKIHIGVRDEGAFWQLSITDNGLGIDEAFITKIFEPFQRLHSWEQIRGTGLGLAVCKKIVENCGGKIWVASVPGQGSVFYITLPKPKTDKLLVA